MIQIGLISHSPHLTGAERMLLNLAVLLKTSQSNINPVLIIPAYEGGLYSAALNYDIDVRVTELPQWYVFANPNDVQYWNRLADSHMSLRSILRESGCNCVLVNTLTNIGGAMAAIDLQIPLITWVHGVLDSFLLPGRATTDWSYLHDRFLLDSASKIVAVSQWVKTFLDEMSDGYLEKTVQIYNWTDVHPPADLTSPKPHPPRFVCLNTFDGFKGHDTLVDAFYTLLQEGYDISLYMYGAGGYLENVKNKCEKLGVQNKVYFMSRTTDAHSVYANSFCLINPSYIESFGMTLIEAMSCKIPVISARSGGPEEFIYHGKNGFLFPAGDAQALANCMRALLDNPELVQQLGEAGYETVQQHFSGDIALQKFVEVIQQTVNEFKDYHSAVQTLKDLFQVFYQNAAKNYLGRFSYEPVGALSRAASHISMQGNKKLLALELYGKYRPSKNRLEYSITVPVEGLSGLMITQCPPIFPEACNVNLKVETLTGKTLRDTNFVLHKNVSSSLIQFTQLLNSKGQNLILAVDIFQPNLDTLKQMLILFASRLLNRPLKRTILRVALILGE